MMANVKLLHMPGLALVPCSPTQCWHLLYSGWMFIITSERTLPFIHLTWMSRQCKVSGFQLTTTIAYYGNDKQAFGETGC